MRKLICLLVACLMVTAGCASLKNGLLSRETPRFAVVDWDRLVKQHPKYKVWQKQKRTLKRQRTSGSGSSRTVISSLPFWVRCAPLQEKAETASVPPSWQQRLRKKRPRNRIFSRKSGKP